MWWALGCALAAACCYGVASVLQALAASEFRHDVGLSALVRLLFRPWFLVGTVLDLVGFAGHLVALRVLPLVVAQAAMAACLAVTALVARWVLGVVLRSREWVAVIMVCVGLGLLANSTGQVGSARAGATLHVALLGAVPVLVLAGLVATRLAQRWRTAVLGLVSGLGFADVAIAGRVAGGLDRYGLLTDPASYVMILAGAVAFVHYAIALRDGGVTVATALMLIGETVPPAFIGVALLGDHTLPGFTILAVAGFAVATVGTLTLARFADLSHASEPEPDVS